MRLLPCSAALALSAIRTGCPDAARRNTWGPPAASAGVPRCVALKVAFHGPASFAGLGFRTPRPTSAANPSASRLVLCQGRGAGPGASGVKLRVEGVVAPSTATAVLPSPGYLPSLPIGVSQGRAVVLPGGEGDQAAKLVRPSRNETEAVPSTTVGSVLPPA